MNNSASTTVYREFLWPSINTCIGLLIVWPTIWLTVYPWDHNTGGWYGLLATAALFALALARSKSIELTSESLRVGNASIPLAELGDAQALRQEDARLARGPKLNPAAYVLFRGTTQKLVLLEIVSSQDPTPYWLFSSRTPERFVEALAAAKRG